MIDKQIKISSILLIFAILTPFFPYSLRAGKLEAIRDRIEKTGQLLKEEESLHQRERGEAASARKSLEGRVRVLGEEIAKIEKENSKLEKEIKRVELSKGEKAGKKQACLILISGIRGLLSNEAKWLQEEINSGIPYDKENRLAGVSTFNKKIKDEDADVPECSRELYHLFMGEIGPGYTSEIYTDEIETEEGKIKKAKFLRIGRNILYYRTNDGKETAKLIKDKEGFKWKKDLCRTCRTNIWKAIQIMEGRRIPHLVDLPIDFSRIKINDETEGRQ